MAAETSVPSDDVLREIVAARQPLGLVLLGDRCVLVGGDSPCDVNVADLAAGWLAARSALRGLMRERATHIRNVAGPFFADEWVREDPFLVKARECLPETSRG